MRRCRQWISFRFAVQPLTQTGFRNLTAFFALALLGTSCQTASALRPQAATPQPAAPKVPQASASIPAEPLPKLRPGSTPAAESPLPSSTLPSWDRRLWDLYGSYEKGALARAAAYHEQFAPQLRLYLGKPNVTVAQAIRLMESFFRVRPNPYYVVRGAVQTPSNSSARALVEAKWEEACPREWAQDNFVCERRVRLKVHTEADEQGRIVEFNETAGPRFRYRVLADSVSGYESPHSGCDESHGASAAVELPNGTLVEATGRYIQSFGCGPCERLIQFQYEGSPYWAVLASCIRVYDEQTGPHTGGEDFLVEVE